MILIISKWAAVNIFVACENDLYFEMHETRDYTQTRPTWLHEAHWSVLTLRWWEMSQSLTSHRLHPVQPKQKQIRARAEGSGELIHFTISPHFWLFVNFYLCLPHSVCVYLQTIQTCYTDKVYVTWYHNISPQSELFSPIWFQSQFSVLKIIQTDKVWLIWWHFKQFQKFNNSRNVLTCKKS